MARKPLKFEMNPLLTGPTLEARNRSGSPYRELNIADVDVDPDQPRRSFSTETIAELAASIKQHGLINPILVRLTEGGTYRVVAGERRLRACRLLGKETVPAIIENEEDAPDILAKQLVENLQREDLAPLERAEAIGKMRDTAKLSVRELASQLGVSKSFVQRSLDILDLPEDLRSALAAGSSESKILMLSQVKDVEARQGLLAKLDDLTRVELEREISRLSGFKPTERVSHRGTDARGGKSLEDRRIQEELQKFLGMRVQISRRPEKPEQGKVSIEFYSEDDLRELYTRIAR